MKLGDYVRMNFDATLLRASADGRPADWLPSLRSRYEGEVGTVVALSPSGRVAQVKFPDGKTWEGPEGCFIPTRVSEVSNGRF